MTIYVGIDGGGTKTQVAVFDIKNRNMVFVTGEASNPNSVGWETAIDRIHALIGQGLTRLGAQTSDIVGVCAGMAGVDRPSDVERMQNALKQAYAPATIGVTNDALAALTAGTKGKAGVVLIAGTGSICVGEDSQGEVVRSGGYGYLIGDEGSGFAIGRAGVMAALQAVEGRGPQTTLWQACQEHFNIRDREEVIGAVYQSTHPVGTIASFAKSVLCAFGRDDVATEIVERAVDDHARLITSVCHRLDDSAALIVVLAGGMYTNVAELTARLQTRLPNAQLIPLAHTAASGAVLRAMLLTEASGAFDFNATGFHNREDLIQLWEQSNPRTI